MHALFDLTWKSNRNVLKFDAAEMFMFSSNWRLHRVRITQKCCFFFLKEPLIVFGCDRFMSDPRSEFDFSVEHLGFVLLQYDNPNIMREFSTDNMYKFVSSSF